MARPCVLILALLSFGCRRKAPDVEPMQLTTSLVDAANEAAADPPLVPCVAPARVVLVGSVERNLKWIGAALADEHDAFDPSTLTKVPGMPPAPGDAVSADAGQTETHGSRSIEHRGSTAVVLDGAGNELFRAPKCTSTIGDEWPWRLSPTGRFLECEADKLRITLFDLDDPKRRSTRIDRLHEFPSPDDAYVIGVPYAPMFPDSDPWRGITREKLEYRPVFDKPRVLSTDVEPSHGYPRMKIAFCGHGELFAAYASHPGDRPNELLVFSAAGRLLASGPSIGAHGVIASAYASFDPSGAHVAIVVVDTISPGVGVKTFVYRLEH